MPSSFAVWTSTSMQSPSKIAPKEARGHAQEGPERSKTTQRHPRAPQDISRDGQKASLRASGSALEALWTRLQRHWSVHELILRGDFEAKMKIDRGNADFLKSMLSLRREHSFWGPKNEDNLHVGVLEVPKIMKNLFWIPFETSEATSSIHSSILGGLTTIGLS